MPIFSPQCERPGQHAERHPGRALLALDVERLAVLDEVEQRVVHVGASHAHHAVGAGLARVRVERIVKLPVDLLPGEHKRENSGRDAVVAEPALVELPALIAAELQPVEDARAGLHALEKRFDAAQALLAQLRQRRAVVGRREHHEMAERTAAESLAVIEVHPFPHDGAAGRVRDAGEALALAAVGKRVGQRLVEGARHVVERDGVDEAHVTAEVDVTDLEIEALRVGLLGKPLRQIAVGGGACGAPTVNKYHQHGVRLLC